MENQVQTAVDQVKEEAKSFHVVETSVLQEVINFLVKRPYEEVHMVLNKLMSTTKTATLIPPTAEVMTPPAAIETSVEQTVEQPEPTTTEPVQLELLK